MSTQEMPKYCDFQNEEGNCGEFPKHPSAKLPGCFVCESHKEWAGPVLFCQFEDGMCGGEKATKASNGRYYCDLHTVKPKIIKRKPRIVKREPKREPKREVDDDDEIPPLEEDCEGGSCSSKKRKRAPKGQGPTKNCDYSETDKFHLIIYECNKPLPKSQMTECQKCFMLLCPEHYKNGACLHCKVNKVFFDQHDQEKAQKKKNSEAFQAKKQARKLATKPKKSKK